MLLLILGLSVGYVSVDKDYTVQLGMNDLNEKIENIYEFEREQWGWGGSLLLVENNLAFKAKILKGSEMADLDSISLGLFFDTKLFELGYAVEFSRCILSLSGGGGQSLMNLKSVKESEAIDFPVSLLDPGGSLDYKGSTFVVSASADILLAISDYLGLGVSIGYVHGVRTPEMVIEKMEDIEIQNAPSVPLNQGYVKFLFAIGDFATL